METDSDMLWVIKEWFNASVLENRVQIDKGGLFYGK